MNTYVVPNKIDFKLIEEYPNYIDWRYILDTKMDQETFDRLLDDHFTKLKFSNFGAFTNTDLLVKEKNIRKIIKKILDENNYNRYSMRSLILNIVKYISIGDFILILSHGNLLENKKIYEILFSDIINKYNDINSLKAFYSLTEKLPYFLPVRNGWENLINLNNRVNEDGYNYNIDEILLKNSEKIDWNYLLQCYRLDFFKNEEILSSILKNNESGKKYICKNYKLTKKFIIKNINYIDFICLKDNKRLGIKWSEEMENEYQKQKVREELNNL
ncbi:hypothetical protein Bp8pS_069 [Bacillus phage vB_BpuM-BpSp]|nr:hypothetical protein Bp8pS_069 [Bacillus phage vB_BpuM-BpSp]